MTECIERADFGYNARVFVKFEDGGFWIRHHQGIDPYQPSGVALGTYALPFVWEGRWLVYCPCGGAQLATPDFPRFFCVSCLNAHVDHLWVDVRWPDPALVEAVDAALLPRPLAARCWLPNENVGKLLTENHAHGLIDPDNGDIAGDIGRQELYAELVFSGSPRELAMACPVAT